MEEPVNILLRKKQTGKISRSVFSKNRIFSIIGGFWSVQVLLARYPEVELRDSKVHPKILRRYQFAAKKFF